MNFGGSGCPIAIGSCEPGFTPSSRELAHEIATKSNSYIVENVGDVQSIKICAITRTFP